MSESEAAKVAGRLQKDGDVWETDPPVTQLTVVSFAEAVARELDRLQKLAEPPLHELADADQVAHEVESLRQQLGAVSFALRAEGADPVRAAELVREAADEALGRLHDVEQQLEAEVERSNDLARQLNKVEGKLMDALVEAERAKDDATAGEALLHQAYVTREVPWTDVAAGMMTLSREEHPRPWMVEGWAASGNKAVLRNGQETFIKDPAEGETVRVLVPYVTPEQAEALVRTGLGGTEVGA